MRLTEVKLPLGHTDEDLRAAVLKRLKLRADDLVELSVFRRAVDARKPKAIVFIYTIDVTVKDEARVMARLQVERHVSATPEMGYKITRAPTPPAKRPVVIGAGPCGIFAGLILAEMGLRPLILERCKVVRERTKDTFGFWRKRAMTAASFFTETSIV